VQVSSTVHNKPSFVPKRNPQNNPRLRKRSRRIRFVLRSIFPHPQSHTPQGSGAFFGGGCRSTFGAAESFFSLDSSESGESGHHAWPAAVSSGGYDWM